jgi:diaminohydroxyphosphoribosylaminopyrimidine deaminase/5-amino-6-(5-phosphoribosylamino)uracil reductase
MVQQMRHEADAIMVGINTVLADDPQLTVRDQDGRSLPRQPVRVVLDSHCRTPVSARMLREPGTTLIFTSAGASPAGMKSLRAAGAAVIPSPSTGDGLVDPVPVMAELGRRDVTSLLVEGGGTVLGSLFDAGLVDKVYAFIAPMIIGGGGAPSPVAGRGVPKMAQARRLRRTSIEPIGADWLITGYPDREDEDVYRNS